MKISNSQKRGLVNPVVAQYEQASQLGQFVPLEILFFNMEVDPLEETLEIATLQLHPLPGTPLQDPM